MNAASHLKELARQVRESTLELLKAAEGSRLTWAPAGTSNHVLWHAGHALWLQDRLCLEPITGKSELPDGWEEKFGMNCRPVSSTLDWPTRSAVAELLERQLARIYHMLDVTDDARLAIPRSSAGETRCLSGTIIHGFHDEARHQGEMYLLIKLARVSN